MKWRSPWPEALLALLVIAVECWPSTSSKSSGTILLTEWPSQRKIAARERARDLWYHGFDNYMTFAFPADELAPLSCKGRGPDWKNPHNWASNDVAGNFSLTLIDVVDTFVILGDVQGFNLAVKDIIDYVSFDVNTKPQVFETTIRVMGGLLSGHIFASRVGQPFHLSWYEGQLLDLATDLGNRLLPAFDTFTGLPYARTNLRHGVPKGESYQTCTAGAGSLILEFGTLSRLTGDDRFEKAAYKAYFALWNRKSSIGLVGNTIDVRTGLWSQPEVSGIGAGIDSFYEYALKWYVLTGDVEFLDVWHDEYASVMQHSRSSDGFWFRNVDIHTGEPNFYTVDSLSSFWPGLQVLGGDVENAIKSHLMYWNLWKKFSGLPEVWDTRFMQATSLQYPLRPEFAESTWYLYRATRDPFYLEVGNRILHDLETRSKVECGLAGIKDLRTNDQDDRMESFVLSETLKYLYLLFDEDNFLNSDDSNYVFTTEAHLLTLESEHLKPMSPARRRLRGAENLQCPAYIAPLLTGSDRLTGLNGGIRARADVDYARLLVNGITSDADRASWSPYGYCEVPKGEAYSYDFVLSNDGAVVPEDLNPPLEKLAPVADGFLLRNITGIRVHIVSRLDGKGYAITHLGPYAVRSGQVVYVSDRALVVEPTSDNKRARSFVNLRFNGTEETKEFQAYTSLFGADLHDDKPIGFTQNEPNLVFDETNHEGCLPYQSEYSHQILVVHRGECAFVEKLLAAKEAGAVGVVVLSDVDSAINPSVDEGDLATIDGKLDDVVLVVLPKTPATELLEMMKAGQVTVTVIPAEEKEPEPLPLTPPVLDNNRVLYLNGYPLTNTRLTV